MQNEAPLTRDAVTKRILSRKVEFGVNWFTVAEQLNKSIEWTVAACLGQMQMTTIESGIVASIFDLNFNERQWLETIPYKNSLNCIPSDPLLYRLHEVLPVHYIYFIYLHHYVSIFKGAWCLWTGSKRNHP